jgi:hypothetical protein
MLLKINFIVHFRMLFLHQFVAQVKIRSTLVKAIQFCNVNSADSFPLANSYVFFKRHQRFFVRIFRKRDITEEKSII